MGTGYENWTIQDEYHFALGAKIEHQKLSTKARNEGCSQIAYSHDERASEYERTSDKLGKIIGHIDGILDSCLQNLAYPIKRSKR